MEMEMMMMMKTTVRSVPDGSDNNLLQVYKGQNKSNTQEKHLFGNITIDEDISDYMGNMLSTRLIELYTSQNPTHSNL